MGIAEAMPPMSAAVRAAEENERRVGALTPRWTELANRAIELRSQEVFREWQGIHDQIAATVKQQTELLRQAEGWFKEANADYMRMRDLDDMLRADYVALSRAFAKAAENTGVLSRDDMMRAVTRGLQLSQQEVEALTIKLTCSYRV